MAPSYRAQRSSLSTEAPARGGKAFDPIRWAQIAAPGRIVRKKAFIALGWLFLAIILVLAVFFAVGFYTLTAVELVAGILVFAWIILFIRNAAALQDDAAAAA